MTTTQEIADLLLSTGTVLTQSMPPQKETRIIRHMQQKLATLVDENLPEVVRCVVFTLDLITNDIFYNLSGDGVYHELIIEVRFNVYREYGKVLINLGKVFNAGNSEIRADIFCELISVYQRELQRLDKAIYHEKLGSRS